MPKLSKISSTATVVYLIISLSVTLIESFAVKNNFQIYLSIRFISILVALPCYFLFKKNALNPLPQILFAISLLIYNIGGYCFIPLYLPSFIQSVFALAFFIFMTRQLFLIAVATMATIFSSFIIMIHDQLPYNNGELSKSDLIMVLMSTCIVSLLIHHFYTAHRNTAESVNIKFGTAGRLSARAIHDIKGSLQSPFLISDEIKLALASKNYQRVEQLGSDLTFQFQVLQNYLINLNHIVSSQDSHNIEFNVTDCIRNAQIILKNRLSLVLFDIKGDKQLFGPVNLFTSVFINLICNSLDQFEVQKRPQGESNKIQIHITNSQIVYTDFTILSPNIADKISSTEHFSTKSDGHGGLGIYLIKEALEQFHSKLTVVNINSNLIFKIIFKKNWF